MILDINLLSLMIAMVELNYLNNNKILLLDNLSTANAAAEAVHMRTR